MADTTVENGNKAAEPASTLTKNAPPTPPETQTASEIKPPESNSDLPPITSEPMKTAGAPVVPEPVAQPKPIPSDPVPAPASLDSTEAPVQDKMAEAEKLAAQPENPTESAAASAAQPVNAEAHAAPLDPLNGDAKTSPKPVSVEEIPDPELPVAKPARPTSESSKDVEMSGAAPEVAPADSTSSAQGLPVADATSAATDTPIIETVTGDKRKADDAGDVNGAAAAEKDPEAELPVLKKQKSNGSGPNGTGKKAGRPKKEKKAPAEVGKTARRTRSQAKLE